MGVTVANNMYHMCVREQYYPNSTWVIVLSSLGMDVKCVASIWKIIMNPRDIEMENISNVFLDTVTGSQTCDIVMLTK